MPRTEGVQQTAIRPQWAIAWLAVWLVSGALSCAVVVCMHTLTVWMFLEGPPADVRLDSTGQFYQAVEFTAPAYCLFLARALLSEAPQSLFAGLLCGAITALVTLYWRRTEVLISVPLLWGIFAAGANLLAGVFQGEVKLGQLVWVATSGTAFGFLQALLYRQLYRIVR